MVRYLALFDLDLGEVNPEQLSMFISARAARYVDHLHPIATPHAPRRRPCARSRRAPMALTGYVSEPPGRSCLRTTWT